MNTVVCGFGNPDNRGCEALIRTTTFMLRDAFPDTRIDAFSNDFGNVEMPKLDSVDSYYKSFYPRIRSVSGKVYYALYKIFGSAKSISWIMNVAQWRKTPNVDLCVSIGGDNYCYNDKIDYLTTFHRHYKKQGATLVHWGSSFESSCISTALIRDLSTFDLIMVRETLSYKALQEKGIKANIKVVPDPAFIMTSQKPKDYSSTWENLVGINISPLVRQYSSDSHILFDNVIELIDHITVQEGRKVLLVPHVSDKKTGEGDYSVMQEVLNHVKRKDLCIPVGFTYSAQEYKYIISKCSLFIGARTHSTIAAYSSCVPTVVIGYSVKSRGIAIDLFGTSEKYVIPVQNMQKSSELVEEYLWLDQNQQSIREHLIKIMPEYINKARSGEDCVKEIYDSKQRG